jgi:hypothetical protein
VRLRAFALPELNERLEPNPLVDAPRYDEDANPRGAPLSFELAGTDPLGANGTGERVGTSTNKSTFFFDPSNVTA